MVLSASSTALADRPGLTRHIDVLFRRQHRSDAISHDLVVLLGVAARDAIGDALSAVIADSPSLPRRELLGGIEFARRHEIRLEVVRTNEMADPSYRRNGADRCAFCKEALTDAVLSHPRFRDRTLLLGVNVDDLGDHRPGQRTAQRGGARFPLDEAGLAKAEVRELARDLNLETWNKPAAACLA